MDDFGTKTKDLLKMWETVKNTALPDYFYYIILAAFVTVVGLLIFRVIYTHKKKIDRKARLKARYANKK